MTELERRARIADALRAESGEVKRWWWLSFCDPRRPKGSQFLGVAIVRGRGMGTAVAEAHKRGCNPGGEVQGLSLPPWATPPKTHVNRLLAKAEIDELKPVWKAQKKAPPGPSGTE